MDELECVLKILRDENTLIRAKNATLRDKITELETKLAEAQNNSNNSLKLPLSNTNNPH